MRPSRKLDFSRERELRDRLRASLKQQFSVELRKTCTGCSTQKQRRQAFEILLRCASRFCLLKSASVFDKSIGWLFAHRASGSWLWVIIAVCGGLADLMIAARSERSEVFKQDFSVPVLGVMAWLIIGSSFIKYAQGLSEQFRHTAESFLGSSNSALARFSLRKRAVLHPGYLVFALTSCLLVWLSLAACESFSETEPLVLIPCFYYAGVGFWGTIVVAGSVRAVAGAAHSLDPKHPDELGGLGFARTYSDRASLLLLSGIVVVPIGVSLVVRTRASVLVDGSWRNIIGFSAAVILLFGWVFFSAFASVWGRIAIARRLERLRDRVLRMTSQQRNMIDASESDLVDRREREIAAVKLKTEFLIGAGIWRDLANVVLSLAVALLTHLAGL